MNDFTPKAPDSKPSWYELDLVFKANWPSSPGVYAVYLDGILSYIGSSNNIEARLRGYNIRPGYAPGFFSFWGRHNDLKIKARVSKRDGEWLMREYRLIQRLTPPLNIQHNPSAKRVSRGK